MGGKSFLTSSILRKMATFHKSEQRCVVAVALSTEGTRFLTAGDVPRPNERVDYLERCPVCGAPSPK